MSDMSPMMTLSKSLPRISHCGHQGSLEVRRAQIAACAPSKVHRLEILYAVANRMPRKVDTFVFSSVTSTRSLSSSSRLRKRFGMIFKAFSSSNFVSSGFVADKA